MISAVCWVPKGASKPVPEEVDPPSKEEIEEMVKSGEFPSREEIEEMMKSGEFEARGDSASEDDDGNMDLDGVAQALAAADAVGRTPGTKFDDIADGLRELDMDNYDEEDDGIELFSSGLGNTYYPSNELDPHLKDDDDDDSEELEDKTIKPTDAVIVCARNDDDFCHLEVYVFEELEDGDSNLYVHNDIVLPSFPLCTAWLDCPIKGGEKGNFIAVGSMEPSIEVFNLDVLGEVKPCAVLGGIAENLVAEDGTTEEKEKKKKKKKNKKGKKTSIEYKEGSHTDSVLGLAWNKEYRNILASASADKQVKIWDVSVGRCDITMEHHTDKVQAVAWNHHSPQVLLSGSFDHSIVMKDGRVPTHSGFRWSVTADVESLVWDPHTEHSFVVSLEDGTVRGFDIRTATSSPSSESKPSFTLHAHDQAVCTVSYNPLAPNLLATGSTDKMVKLWDLSNNQPSCIASTNPKAGGVFTIAFSENSSFLLAIGGSKGKLQVWDTLSDAAVSRRFGKYSQGKRVHVP
ncbi:Transducin/WD40 repeat-like superfamily protein [Tripterygium wilfordii]|uniref:Transducin/WD40 repeat-like superfamily protein n=1 Tax=Tripterygium wilfordii TaxID=458696 RepID=A0A7J7E337_TRIWF|nr:uncharacterized WD repeat-containing protein C17D11.16-like [Tripterygium wilfordii]KAF5753007.1 Transducin/WD40 repeat-like superfamily protein [Tripterygium wilfordii]